jgi:deoxyribonuclease-4
MPRLGAHLSIAGGFPRAIDRAIATRCEALQVFTKSANQWRARPLPPEEIREFRRRAGASGVGPIVGHNSYLINVAAANPAVRAQSIAALGEELDRAEALGLSGLVMHPGAFTSGTEDSGLRLIADALRDLLRERRSGETMILLEHTAGQGTVLGHRFEQLATIVDLLDGSPRVGICLDTCHLLVSGYDITSPEGYLATFSDLQRTVGLARLKVLHLNDSKRPCGSRVDRHEHIGKGCLGVQTFARILNDPRLRELPMLIETPKSEAREHLRLDANPWDLRNLRTLRKLMVSQPTGRTARRTGSRR